MINPSGKIRTEFGYRAQDLNNKQANKGFRDSLPFVLASAMMKSIAESVKTARASLSSITKQAQKTVNKARAVLYRQIGGQYGVAVYEANHNSANEARIREANSNNSNKVRPNKVIADSRTNPANTPVNRAFSDIAMINPPQRVPKSPTTPKSRSREPVRDSVQVWFAAAAVSANLVEKAGSLVEKAGKEIGGIGSNVASGGVVPTPKRDIGYIR